MSQFWIFFNLGLKHILDIYSYDHILFLTVLTIPFIIKEWKYLLLQVTLFTLAHTLGLILVATNVVAVKQEAVTAFIPILLFFSAAFNFYKAGKINKKGNIWVFFMTVLYGVIHGLGFLETYNDFLKQVSESKMKSFLLYTLGIQVGQIIIVLGVFLIAYIVQTIFKFTRRELMLITTAFVIGVVVPMILEDKIWLR